MGTSLPQKTLAGRTPYPPCSQRARSLLFRTGPPYVQPSTIPSSSQMSPRKGGSSGLRVLWTYSVGDVEGDDYGLGVAKVDGYKRVHSKQHFYASTECVMTARMRAFACGTACAHEFMHACSQLRTWRLMRKKIREKGIIKREGFIS